MVPIRNNSRIEIWRSTYINNDKDCRLAEDKNAKIVQIENGDGDDYIVEVVDEKGVDEKGALGWRPISEFDRTKYTSVLVNMFDGDGYLSTIAYMSGPDKKWYDLAGNPLPFEVVGFFDIGLLDKEDM